MSNDLVLESKDRSSRFHPRRKARECVFKGLYSLEMSNDPSEKVINDILHRCSLDEPLGSFASSLFKKVIEKKTFLEDTISKFLDNWDIGRIAILDNLILQIGVCELFYFEDVPPKVSISEAIEMAKKFSTDDSPRFVNGILDSVFKDFLESNGKLN